jgi:ABC-type polysaccharide/polyol phosphate transport system ATPase subunit
MSNKYSVELDNCSFSYKSRPKFSLKRSTSINQNEEQSVLKNIHLKLENNKIYGVIGKNGSGKSTLLRLIFDYYQPSSGLISRNFKSGKLLDIPNTYQDDLNSIDNLQALQILEDDRESLNKLERVKEISRLTKNELEVPISHLSKGTQSKVRFGLTLAFIENIDFLGLDEFFNFGDLEFQENATKYLKNEIDNLGSAIITSHSNSLIERICDLVILIHEGEVLDIAESSKVLRKYKKLIL